MRPKTRSSGDDSGWMSIGALARATGVPAETLRTWERRYGVPVPQRKPSGHRLYPASEVAHLRRVSLLLNRGHRPAELLALPEADLERLLAVSGAAPAAASVPRARAPREAAAPDATIAGWLEAARSLDREGLLRGFRAGWTRLGPLRFLEEAAGPFMRAIGDAWADGTLEVRHEHFATACLSDFLREARAPFDERASGPVVAVGAPEGDHHEGGLLMAAAVMSLRGWRVVYLGPNTPAGEFVELAKSRTLDAVALGISAAVPKAKAARFVRDLRTRLPRRTALWAGGSGAPAAARGVERLATLPALDARLARGA